MKKARSGNDAKELSLQDVQRNEQVRHYLKCIHCQVPISYVKEHMRGNKIVHPYFKLKAGQSHAVTCVFNLSSQVNKAASFSKGILKNTGNDTYELKLDLLTSTQKQLSIKEQVNKQPVSKRQPIVKHGYSKSEEKTSYLMTVKKLAKLRFLADEEKEIKRLIKIKLGSQFINWQSFYYESDALRSCFDYFTKSGVFHPVCIQGEYEIKLPSENFRFPILKIKTPYIKRLDQDGVKRIATAEYILFDPVAFKHIQEEWEKGKKEAVVFSELTLKSSPIIQKKHNKFQYLDITGRIFKSEQVFLF